MKPRLLLVSLIALALLASEISSVLQPASITLAASAAEVTSSRTGRPEIKPEAPHPPDDVATPTSASSS